MERWILINFQQTSSTGLGTKGNVMSANDKLETGERVESFQAERLTADELYLVAGGLGATADSTCGTVSVCHSDGAYDGDTSLN